MLTIGPAESIQSPSRHKLTKFGKLERPRSWESVQSMKEGSIDDHASPDTTKEGSNNAYRTEYSLCISKVQKVSQCQG